MRSTSSSCTLTRRSVDSTPDAICVSFTPPTLGPVHPTTSVDSHVGISVYSDVNNIDFNALCDHDTVLSGGLVHDLFDADTMSNNVISAPCGGRLVRKNGSERTVR